MIEPQKISFDSGEFELQGVLHLPDVEQPPVVIGSHGLFSSRRSPKQIELARACNRCGIAFFRFDHRGCGQSSGNFKAVTSIKGRCMDLINAVQTIRARPDIGDKLGLFGSSMGGTVCLAAAGRLSVNALVTYAAPVRANSVVRALEKSDPPASLENPFELQYLEPDIVTDLSTLHHILVIHGESDELVPPSNAHELFAAAGEPKKLILQKNGDHRMSKTEHQENFLKEAVRWYQSCFKAP